MNSLRATVSKILTYSCVDGPGNRLVIFLQGCNFNCSTCHNPHTIGQCDHCGECIPACHADALTLIDGRITFDPDICDQCDACLRACPINANPMVQHYSVEQILEIARRHRPFLSGITVSGGEATLQLKFIIALFESVKADPELAELSCFIDTNGHLGAQSWDKLLSVTDGAMLDIKAFHQPLHAELTGMNNLQSLESAKTLYTAGKLYELRFLMIPGKTDCEAELNSLIDFVAALGSNVRVKLNAFQHHGVRGKALDWQKMSETGVIAAAERLRAAGIDNVITPTNYL
jgi:YjjW family glycine radical enzyme activase